MAYWVVTLLGILLTIVFAAIFKPPSAQELGLPASQPPAYLMTLPYHPLLSLFWLPFAWRCLRGFAYPMRFTLGDQPSDKPAVRGPTLDDSVEPIHATLTVEFAPATNEILQM